MGNTIQLCNCGGKQQVSPNAIAVVDNKNNKNNNNISEEDKNQRKISNVVVNIEQNNDAETYKNILSSKGVQLSPCVKKESSSPKIPKRIEDANAESTGSKEKEDKKEEKNDENKNTTITISDNILMEITLDEKPVVITKERKKKIKGRNCINIIILGDNKVGKSAFCIRFAQNKYEDFYIPSIGIENYQKMIAYNERSYRLIFTVIYGEIKMERQESLLSTADFFFLFYDITKIRSFNINNIYLKQINKYLFSYDKEGNSPNFCLVGNKIDLEGERKVDCTFVNKCIDKYGLKHFDVSVRTAKNLNNLIQFFVSIYDKIAFS